MRRIREARSELLSHPGASLSFIAGIDSRAKSSLKLLIALGHLFHGLGPDSLGRQFGVINRVVDSVPQHAGQRSRDIEQGKVITSIATVEDIFEHTLSITSGDRLPTKSASRNSSGDSDEWHSIDAYWWLREQAESEQPEEV